MPVSPCVLSWFDSDPFLVLFATVILMLLWAKEISTHVAPALVKVEERGHMDV